jgi:hypothetical protein
MSERAQPGPSAPAQQVVVSVGERPPRLHKAQPRLLRHVPHRLVEEVGRHLKVCVKHGHVLPGHPVQRLHAVDQVAGLEADVGGAARDEADVARGGGGGGLGVDAALDVLARGVVADLFRFLLFPRPVVGGREGPPAAAAASRAAERNRQAPTKSHPHQRPPKPVAAQTKGRRIRGSPNQGRPVPSDSQSKGSQHPPASAKKQGSRPNQRPPNPKTPPV